MKDNNNKIQQLELENTELQERIKAYELEIRKLEEAKVIYAKNDSIGNIELTSKFVRWWAGGELTSSFHKLYNELPLVSKQTLAEFSASVLRRLTRVGFFTLFLGFLPALILLIQTTILFKQTTIFKEQTTVFKDQTTILNEQSKKIETQNILLTSQNEKIEKQVYLEEASRRNNLVLLMDNVLQKVNTEIDSKAIKNEPLKLSSSLVGRIWALAQGFQPYKFLEGDKGTLSESLSPERGQFLLSLVSSGMNNDSLDEIFEKALFSYSYLKGAVLDSLYLRNVNLSYANLSLAYLRNSDLRDANLAQANLKGAKLEGADLSRANLISGSLAITNLKNVNFSNANLNSVDLSRSDLTGADLKRAQLVKADLRNSYLYRANLSGANLIKANLEGADLGNSDLTEADLSGANLKNAKVQVSNWLELLNECKVIGIEEIRNKYILSNLITDEAGFKCYELRLKTEFEN